MSKRNLVPKQIVNSAGIHTTVWVKPDQAGNPSQSHLHQVSVPTSVSSASDTDVPEIIQIGEEAGVKVQVTVSPDWNPYEESNLPVYAQIELPDGTRIGAFEFGNPGTYTYKDGVELESEIHAGYSSSYWEDKWDGQDASQLITSDQMKALIKANEWTQQFFSEDESDEMTREELLKKVEDQARQDKESGRLTD